MSESTPTAPAALEQLNDRLVEPEPLCLALLVVEIRARPESTSSRPGPALVEAINDRLRSSMRPYDGLILLPDGHFAITLPTLADADALQGRMGELFAVVEVGVGPQGDDRSDGQEPCRFHLLPGFDVAPTPMSSSVDQ